MANKKKNALEARFDEFRSEFDEFRAEVREERQVTNVLLRDLLKELHVFKIEVRSDIQDLRARFDIHRTEAFRRITALEKRGKKNGK